ncbi:metal ABC transporter solute-binding protein, Zn/Mn family [Natronomonas gomsonensis]|uniref:metal ABC transporter substrate-binding protein n=1 Tax=Natronomonas gomsonensis TaxID=1046043 RepID=UPI0015BA4E74|nr:zinc ABC transporter substrate-binding protein [Natronomonas gomsonensis]
MNPTRRQVLGGTAAVVGGSLAGCLGSPDTGNGPEGGEGVFTSFFTLADFARHVVGDVTEVQNPIPPGEMGHQYEVGSQAQVDAARSAAFVYLDIPGFQNWALDSAENLEANHESVTVVDALADVELREIGAGHEHSGEDHEDEHTDEHTDEHDGEHEDEHTDDHDDEHEDEHTDEHEDEHVGGDFDPHYWTDPVRSATSVRTIGEALAQADPDNAETYRSNTDAYVGELETLDETFESELSERAIDTVVVAGHDSYQYLAERYGFEVHSPVGVSPNAEPGSAEISDTIDVVDDNGIDVILYDTFSSPRLAETIVSESNAEEAVAISSAEGTKGEWLDDGWGYVEQMKELNLPAFKAALKAE